ncbi:MAG: hypothetical protein FKY71_09650 [Spiribacter salinus]|uniref:Uncharacterized protein n=1 Tax=Spiribacter salinus TaxID=1335746 RepID=A0A540VR62_9GAMM|nr:MAG: hypothetical protein FKY71_09650 [Spiribacter salinus]
MAIQLYASLAPILLALYVLDDALTQFKATGLLPPLAESMIRGGIFAVSITASIWALTRPPKLRPGE